MIRECTVESLGELIDAVTPASPDPDTGRRRDSGVYHGSSVATRPLLTTLDRLGGIDPPHSKAHLEAHILRNFARYSRPHLPAAPANDWELLVIAQHYGAPTRLLDWSYSPVVAAHFATCSPGVEADAAIWRLDWQRIHQAFDLPPLALLIDDLLDPHIFGTGRAVTPWQFFSGEGPDVACLIEPPSLDARIVAQAATFTISSDTTQAFEVYLAERDLDSALTKYVIPATAVPNVRDQLDLVGFEERRLFPDLDGVAASIRRYYT